MRETDARMFLASKLQRIRSIRDQRERGSSSYHRPHSQGPTIDTTYHASHRSKHRKHHKPWTLSKYKYSGSTRNNSRISNESRDINVKERPRRRRRHRRRRRRHRRPIEYISPWIKCLLFSFNFFFWLVGSGLAGIGFWILTEKDKMIRDFLDVVFDPSILMCAAGCIIFTIGFFGCLGALRENIYLLKTFHIMLTVILILELLVAVWVFVFYYVPEARELIGHSTLETSLKQAIVRYRDDDDLRDMIDTVQQEFRCCGVSDDDYGYRDWQQNVYFNCSHSNPSVERCGVPHSCCKPKPGEIVNVMCGFDTTSREVLDVSEKVYVEGCLKGFGFWLERNTIIIGGVCLSVILPQLLGICLSRSFIDQIHKQTAQWRRW